MGTMGGRAPGIRVRHCNVLMLWVREWRTGGHGRGRASGMGEFLLLSFCKDDIPSPTSTDDSTRSRLLEVNGSYDSQGPSSLSDSPREWLA